jgi:hypothetical protein
MRKPCPVFTAALLIHSIPPCYSQKLKESLPSCFEHSRSWLLAILYTTVYILSRKKYCRLFVLLKKTPADRPFVVPRASPSFPFLNIRRC